MFAIGKVTQIFLFLLEMESFVMSKLVGLIFNFCKK